MVRTSMMPNYGAPDVPVSYLKLELFFSMQFGKLPWTLIYRRTALTLYWGVKTVSNDRTSAVAGMMSIDIFRNNDGPGHREGTGR